MLQYLPMLCILRLFTNVISFSFITHSFSVCQSPSSQPRIVSFHFAQSLSFLLLREPWLDSFCNTGFQSCGNTSSLIRFQSFNRLCCCCQSNSFILCFISPGYIFLKYPLQACAAGHTLCCRLRLPWFLRPPLH